MFVSFMQIINLVILFFTIYTRKSVGRLFVQNQLEIPINIGVYHLQNNFQFVNFNTWHGWQVAKGLRMWENDKW